MNKPKAILLNGFAASGKTTTAKKYIEEHPLALMIEGDELIVNIGHWLEHESKSRLMVYEMTKSMMCTYLQFGHDVLLPYLVTDASHVEEFETIAGQCGADFYEVLLHSDRQDAVAKLLQRGMWGEAGMPPLTGKDLPEIESLITKMEAELEKRPGARVIRLKDNDPGYTYDRLIEYVTAQ